MKIDFTRRTIARLKKEINTAQRLNNFRLFKLSKAILMIASGLSIISYSVRIRLDSVSTCNQCRSSGMFVIIVSHRCGKRKVIFS
jgi:hypothetical protein